jgi:SAM-dependent methyltransferase
VENGWEASANAWIQDVGGLGDFGRRHVLDPVMLREARACAPQSVLDVGCGEGRFCRMLRAHGVRATGVDPTPALLAAARARHHDGAYVRGAAERLPFADAAFDLVVSYLSLIDIADVEPAIMEMTRVLAPGGTMLIANLNSFNTACADRGWVKDAAGRRLHYPIDHYLEERAMWIEYRGIRIVNHHRPQTMYLRALLRAGLILRDFEEPAPTADAPEPKASNYRRVPWFHVMRWQKPA